MQHYGLRESILLYRKLPAETMDDEKQRIVAQLLADEEAKELPPPSRRRNEFLF